MLEGHGDEIGYMVEYIDAQGFVYFQALGGLVVPLSAAERIRILTKNGVVNGVMGTRPPHLMKADERKSVAANELKSMPCDIGASSYDEVSVGDPAVVDAGWRPLAGTRVSGRGFDDRCGTFAMCRAFIRLVTSPESPKVNLHYVSSVCEEIGLGIVPADREERLWRDVTGRLCCLLAEEAEEVYRLWCGLPQRLK